MPPISETEMKNYKAKSNLFYFIEYIMIFQLGSWQAHRVNLSWERFGASVPYLIYVFIPAKWSWRLWPPEIPPFASHNRKIIFTSLLQPLRFTGEVAQIWNCFTISFRQLWISALFSFRNSMKPFQLPFIGNEIINLGVLQRLVILPFLQILQFSLSAL